MYQTTYLMPEKTLKDRIADHRAFILKHAQKLCQRTKIDAEDLVQDTLIRAITNIERFDAETNLKAWLFTMMKNLFINEYRRNRKVIDVELRDNINITSANDALRSLSCDEIRAVFSTLRPKQHELMEMRADGYKYEEIADLKNLPMGTVRSQLHKGKKDILKKYKGENYGE